MTRCNVRLSLLLAVVCFPCGLVGAETGQRRTIPVVAIDRENRAPADLTAENFRAEIGGKPVRVLSLTANTEPHRVAILVEIGRNMRAEPKWRLAWAIARDLALSLAPRHKVAIFTVGENLTARSGLTQDPKALEETLAQAQKDSESGNSVYSHSMPAITHVAARMAPAKPGDAICLITAWTLARDLLRREGLIRGAKTVLVGSGVRLFMIYVPPHGVYETTPDSTSVDADIEITSGSGGLRKAAADLTQVILALNFTYSLEVEFPSEVQNPRGWNLEVVDANGRKRKDLKVFYPNYYLPKVTGN